MATRLKVGLYIPNGDGPMSAGITRWRDIVAMANAAERVGFDSVWVADHMVFAFDGVPVHGRWECWTILSALAAETERVELGPLVSCMGFRNPALLAKMTETLDEVSDGRVTLALGAGWHEPEFTTFGYPFDHRASRFEEGFRIIHDLLRTGRSDFRGAFQAAPGAEIHPAGPRAGRIPIIVGSDGERLLRTAARFADGWNTNWTWSPEEVVPRMQAVDAACRDVGRDPATLARSCCVFVDLPGATGTWFSGGRSTPKPRSPREAADLLRGYQAIGIDQVMLWIDPCTPDGVARFGETIAILREEAATS